MLFVKQLEAFKNQKKPKSYGFKKGRREGGGGGGRGIL